jgi:hypothetical protein
VSYFHYFALFLVAMDRSPQSREQFFLLLPAVCSKGVPQPAQITVTRGPLRPSAAARITETRHAMVQQSCFRCLGWKVTPHPRQTAGGRLQAKHCLRWDPISRENVSEHPAQVAHSDLLPSAGFSGAAGGLTSPALIAARMMSGASPRSRSLLSSGSGAVPKSYSRVRAGRHHMGFPFMVFIACS